MKNIFTKISVSMAMMFTAVAAHANSRVNEGAICELVTALHPVFNILRILAFVGVAFIVMGWAWGFITAGEVKWKKEDQTKFVALLVGAIMLFSVGALLSFLVSTAGHTAIGCNLTTW